MKKQKSTSKSRVRNAATDRGYDEAVEILRDGLEDQTAFIAAPDISNEFDDQGVPRWDDTERAAPPPPLLNGEDVSVPLASLPEELSEEELKRRAQALGIPGRAQMTKMQLANEVRNAIGPS